MGQIVTNYLCVFVVPLLIGTVVRVLFRHVKKAWLITLVMAALAVIGWGVYHTAPSHGSEWYGVIALIITSTAAGALLAGLIMRVKGSRQLR